MGCDAIPAVVVFGVVIVAVFPRRRLLCDFSMYRLISLGDLADAVAVAVVAAVVVVVDGVDEDDDDPPLDDGRILPAATTVAGG
jgi:hypothetical protein